MTGAYICIGLAFVLTISGVIKELGFKNIKAIGIIIGVAIGYGLLVWWMQSKDVKAPILTTTSPPPGIEKNKNKVESNGNGNTNIAGDNATVNIHTQLVDKEKQARQKKIREDLSLFIPQLEKYASHEKSKVSRDVGRRSGVDYDIESKVREYLKVNFDESYVQEFVNPAGRDSDKGEWYSGKEIIDLINAQVKFLRKVIEENK